MSVPFSLKVKKENGLLLHFLEMRPYQVQAFDPFYKYLGLTLFAPSSYFDSSIG